MESKQVSVKEIDAKIRECKQKSLELRLSLYKGEGKVNTAMFKKLRRAVARLKGAVSLAHKVNS